MINVRDRHRHELGDEAALALIEFCQRVPIEVFGEPCKPPKSIWVKIEDFLKKLANLCS